MNRKILALLAGFAVTLAALFGVGVCLAVLGDYAGWSTIDIHVGPIEIWRFERNESGTGGYFGPGILLISLLVGIANAYGATKITSRAAVEASQTAAESPR